jgi:hypothetical protein
MMRWLAKLNFRKRPLSGNEPVELSYLLSGTGVLGDPMVVARNALPIPLFFGSLRRPRFVQRNVCHRSPTMR